MLALEIRKHGLDFLQQHGVSVYYDGIVVGEYYADIIVEKSILMELKDVKSIDEMHFAEYLNYLKATGFRIYFLLNFGAPKVEIKRIYH
jgi:GxxExxY protein